MREASMNAPVVGRGDQNQPKVWDTASLPSGERFPYWREVLCEAFTALDSKPRESPHNRSIVTLHEFAGVNGVDLHSFSQNINRGMPEIRRRADTFFFCNFQIEGECRVDHDGRQITVKPGQFYIVDTTRPYWLDFTETFHTVSFRFPSSQMLPLLGDPRRATSQVVDLADPLGGLAASTMQGLLRCGADVPTQARAQLADMVARLVALAVGRQAPSDAESLEHSRKVFHDSIVRYVREHSTDANLRVASVAARFKISARTVQAIFAERNSSFTDTVQECRLVAASAALAQCGASVTETALSCGFTDLSHFSRSFRRRFGCSPRQWRYELSARPAYAEQI